MKKEFIPSCLLVSNAFSASEDGSDDVPSLEAPLEREAERAIVQREEEQQQQRLIQSLGGHEGLEKLRNIVISRFAREKDVCFSEAVVLFDILPKDDRERRIGLAGKSFLDLTSPSGPAHTPPARGPDADNESELKD